MRIAGEAASTLTDLAAEVIEVVFGESSLQKRAGVHARGGVALEVDVVARRTVVLAAEEVVEANLVERRGTSERRQVTTDALGVLVGAHHHGRGVPADVGANASLDVLVAGEPRLVFARNAVHVRSRHRGGKAHLGLAGSLE